MLNAGTWQREAAAEFYRALRSDAPLALVMVMRRIIGGDGGVGAAIDKILARGTARYSWAGGAGWPRDRRPGPAVPPASEPPAGA